MEYAASFSSGCSYCLFNTLNHCILTHHVHLAAPQVRHPRRWLRSQLVLKQPRPLHADGQRQGRHGHRLLCEIPPLYLRPCRLKPFNSQPGAILKLRNSCTGAASSWQRLHLRGASPRGVLQPVLAAAHLDPPDCFASAMCWIDARLLRFFYVGKRVCPSLSNIADAKQSENIGLLQRLQKKKCRQIFETKQILCNSSPAARQRGTSSCPHAGTV